MSVDLRSGGQSPSHPGLRMLLGNQIYQNLQGEVRITTMTPEGELFVGDAV